MSELNICEKCLGDALDMVKERDANDCKMCTLSFDVYTFKQNRRSNTVQKTLICYSCSQQRNVCQCCLLDLKWGITIQERDSLLTMVKGYNIKTPNAQNEMMQRFLTLKNKNNKIGSANLIADEASTNNLLDEMKNILKNDTLRKIGDDDRKINTKPNKKLSNNIKVDKYTKMFPISETFPSWENNSNTTRTSVSNTDSTTINQDVPTSFFLYNVDSNLPEWKINDKIAQMVNQDQWKDNVPSTMIVNHRAQCAGIKFKSVELSEKFIKYINENKQIVDAVNMNGVQRGILQIDQFRLFVVPWPQSFSLNSFGETNDEYLKINQWVRDKLLVNKKSLGSRHGQPDQNLSQNHKKMKKIMKNKKNKRIKTLEL